VPSGRGRAVPDADESGCLRVAKGTRRLALGCKPGAKLCLSGFRPGAETEVLLQLYRPFFTFDQSGYAERAPDAHGQEYRGTWTRVVATRNVDSAETRRQLIDKIADDAVNG